MNSFSDSLVKVENLTTWPSPFPRRGKLIKSNLNNKNKACDVEDDIMKSVTCLIPIQFKRLSFLIDLHFAKQRSLK